MDIYGYLLGFLVISISLFTKFYVGGKKERKSVHVEPSDEKGDTTDESRISDEKQKEISSTPASAREDTMHTELEIQEKISAKEVEKETVDEKSSAQLNKHIDREVQNQAEMDHGHPDNVNGGSGGGNSGGDVDHESDRDGDNDNDDDNDDDDDDDDDNGKNIKKDAVDTGEFGNMLSACVSMQGKRPKNEDRTFIKCVSDVFCCGIFDGHDGSKASEYCAKYLMRNITNQKTFSTSIPKAVASGFLQTDSKFLDKLQPGGSTAILAIIQEKEGAHTVYIANVGDSRCVASVDGTAVALSTDHKPNLPLEEERINKTTHDVQQHTEIVSGQRVKMARIDGILAVSRAIGDLDFKDCRDMPAEEQAVSALPDVVTIQLTQQHQFIVLACDGLWDVLSNQEVVDFINKRLSNASSTEKLAEITRALVTYAIDEKHSTDNVTVLVVKF